MIDIEQASKKAIELLETGLSPSLTYHCLAHTKWVVEGCLTIAANEGITHPYQLLILETAAWYHDTGFTRVYKNHEQEGCKIAKEFLPAMGADADDIERICDLIMDTKIPQKPHSKLAEILCDADLDYLGREDFPEWSERLKKEWFAYEIINSEKDFYERQVIFLRGHKYFTNDAKSRHNPLKRFFLEKLSKSLGKSLQA